MITSPACVLSLTFFTIFILTSIRGSRVSPQWVCLFVPDRSSRRSLLTMLWTSLECSHCHVARQVGYLDQPGQESCAPIGTALSRSRAVDSESIRLNVLYRLMQQQPTFDTNNTIDLTPDRVATFYRKVGGNYDPLFLGTKSQSLSFIYQSLGCFHSLQPSTNPYEAPSVPSLLPNGFVRWQTIQLLMDPDEHSRYLQNAVSLWDIEDANGEILPKEIPRDAFPSEPDPEMLRWHEGVCRRLEYDFVKRNTPRSSPPNFGSYHYHFSGKDPLPDEEDYFSPAPRRSESRHHRHADTDRSSRRRHHHRRLSADYPPHSARRPDSDFMARPDGTRSGFSTPRVSSPPPRAERPVRSNGRDRATWYGRPPSPDMDDLPDVDDIPDHPPPEEELESRPRHRSRHHNLSEPSNSRARRHSHDAYTRKPARDLSPTAPRRSQKYQDSRVPKASKSHSDGTTKFYPVDERAHARHPGVKFRDIAFEGPVPAPDPPQYSPVPPPPPPRPRYRHGLDPRAAEDVRRGSYSGGSTGGSRPGSGGSGSDRPRSYSSAGLHPRNSRWTSPVRNAAKRYIPSSVLEEPPYVSSRRSPIYD